jgi:excisionase family DNA binding protein
MATLKTIQIVSTPDILRGKPRIEGRRITVDLIAYRAVYQGWSLEEIQAAHNVSAAEIHAALSYYYMNKGEIDALIREEETDDEDIPHIRDLDTVLGKLISSEEAASRLGVSKRAVRKLIDSGTLPAKKIGGRWLIHPDDLERISPAAAGPVREPGKLLASSKENHSLWPRDLPPPAAGRRQQRHRDFRSARCHRRAGQGQEAARQGDSERLYLPHDCRRVRRCVHAARCQRAPGRGGTQGRRSDRGDAGARYRAAHRRSSRRPQGGAVEGGRARRV